LPPGKDDENMSPWEAPVYDEEPPPIPAKFIKLLTCTPDDFKSFLPPLTKEKMDEAIDLMELQAQKEKRISYALNSIILHLEAIKNELGLK